MRIPSSFHSTDARSKPDSASATLARRRRRASAGSAGRPRGRPRAARPRRSRQRDLGRPRQVAGEHQRAPRDRARARRPPWRPRRPSARPSAPCRSSPVSSRRRNVGLRLGGARRAASDEQPLARRRRPAPGRSPRSRAIARSTSSTVQRRLGRRLGLDAVDGRVADADAALAGNAGQESDADRRPRPASSRLQQLGEDRDLARARARRPRPRAEAATTSAKSVMSGQSGVRARWRKPPRAARCRPASR